MKNSLHRIPVGLQEAVMRLVSPDTRQRPSTQLLSLIQYFRYLSTVEIATSVVTVVEFYNETGEIQYSFAPQ